jgi:hypothetical protein
MNEIWVWSISEIMLIGKIEVLGEKSVPVALCPNTAQLEWWNGLGSNQD